jgi:phosphate starvation-inducible PhoH-like protein
MARKKNLSKEDIDDVSTFEYKPTKITNGQNGISIHEIPIKIKCLNEKQKTLKTKIEENEIIISIGPAGTGKTYLSLITALHLLKTQPKYKRIVMVKSLTTIKGEEVGFLPGTLWEKLEPFMYSFIGNLDKILGHKSTTKYLMQQGYIEIMPIAYVRGITIDDSIIIVDETQNIDLHTFKTIITRIGSNSKMIFLGDVEQIDRNRKESCLEKVVNLFKETDFVGTVEFSNEDCVRNPIIPRVLAVLEKS